MLSWFQAVMPKEGRFFEMFGRHARGHIKALTTTLDDASDQMQKTAKAVTLFEQRASRRASAVRWNIAQRIVVAWIITIPASGALAGMFYWLASLAGF